MVSHHHRHWVTHFQCLCSTPMVLKLQAYKKIMVIIYSTPFVVVVVKLALPVCRLLRSSHSLLAIYCCFDIWNLNSSTFWNNNTNVGNKLKPYGIIMAMESFEILIKQLKKEMGLKDSYNYSLIFFLRIICIYCILKFKEHRNVWLILISKEIKGRMMNIIIFDLEIMLLIRPLYLFDFKT